MMNNEQLLEPFLLTFAWYAVSHLGYLFIQFPNPTPNNSLKRCTDTTSLYPTPPPPHHLIDHNPSVEEV